jgi:hypothetical protein
MLRQDPAVCRESVRVSERRDDATRKRRSSPSDSDVDAQSRAFFAGFASLGVAPKRSTPHVTWTCTGLSPTDVETVAGAFERDGVFDVGERVTDFPRRVTHRTALGFECPSE